MALDKSEVRHIAAETVGERPTNVRRLKVSAELLAQFLSLDIGHDLIVEGLPDDFQIVDARWVWPRIIELRIQSDTFTAVPPGEEVPEMTVRYKRHGATT